MYKLLYSKSAIKTLKKMPRNISDKIRLKIEKLSVDPFSENSNVKSLSLDSIFRLRVGNWRVIYDVYHNELQILVIKIAPRGEVYK